MQRRTKWLLAAALLGIPAAGSLTLFLLARQHAAKIEPYIRQQAVAYLRERFHADVEIASLRIDIPTLSPVKLYLSKGRGVISAVTGEGVLLKQAGRPVFRMKTMRFEVNLGQIFEPHKGVAAVYLDGVEIIIPPKRERAGGPSVPRTDSAPAPNVRIGEVLITNAKLSILPRDSKRQPLTFDLHRIRLTGAGLNSPMRYEAELRNPKPEGEIKATGHFGPWQRDEPGDTPLDGDYKFERANLGVFSAIGGILHSTGKFHGQVNDIAASGEAAVPDFFLKASGNRLPLYAKFSVQVDGTNGNTILKPVHGRLGRTSFVTSGGIIKHDGDQRRTIALDVNMPAGRLEDVLLLAMKGKDPFMAGTLQLKSKILLPPLGGKVIENLRLDGQFTITDARFLRSQLQDRIDQMSRQAQGQPKNQEIDAVVSGMSGKFTLANELVTLRDLAFTIPGAGLAINGSYNLDNEVIDFHGDLRLQARLSQTQSGWKRWALKPIDPFFARKGAGLYTKIKITGTRKEPKFGRDK
jgi:hypothetical protein